MSVGELASREERPAYVRFERRPIEDVAESVKQGRYVAKDVDFVLITPPYSKDCVEQKVSRWLENLAKEVRDGRTPERWAETWKDAYNKWRNGQEIPLNGTPILGWGVISPAQQKNLISMNCMTVEDLAIINDEGMKRIGMGALDLRNKAKAWLASMKDHGGVTVQMAALESENKVLKASLETLQAQVKALQAMIPQQPQQFQQVHVEREQITASDLLEDDAVEPEPGPVIEDVPKRRGRPPKQESAGL